MKNKKTKSISIFSGTFFILVFLYFGCNQVPEFTDVSINFIPQVDHFFKYDSAYFFNPTPGNVTAFRGVSHKTIQKPGRKTLNKEDSIFFKITTQEKVIKKFKNQTFGTFDFSKDDLFNWNQILDNMKMFITPIGQFISEYMDKEMFDSITLIDSSSNLTSLDSNNIYKSILKIINDKKFYLKYQKQIKEFITDEKYVQHLNDEVDILIKKNIFKDTLGTPHSSLNPRAKDELKWFNRLLLSRFSTDQSLQLFIKYPVAASQVFSIKFEQGPLHQQQSVREVTRYFSLNNKMMKQLSFTEDNYGYIASDLSDSSNIINNFYFNTRTQYPIAPLIAPSDIPFIKPSEFTDVIMPGKTVFSLLKYSAIGDTLFYNMKIYYDIIGTIYRNNRPISISGTITILSHLYKIGLVNYGYDQGYFTDWKMDIAVRKKDIEGKVESYTETRILKLDNKD